MGVRTRRIAVIGCVLACTGCGVVLRSHSQPTASPFAVSSSVGVSEASSSPAPYTAPGTDLRTLADRFVVATLAYDSWLEEPGDFLTRAADLATRREVQRLRNSERAQLNWPALVQRFERATVHVVGISQKQVTATPTAGTASDFALESATVTATLQLEVLRVTRSDLGTVRDFVAITLVAVRTPAGWRVDRASGGGL